MIISFSGMDGAGKSTQIELLSEAFLEKGYDVKLVWARGGYTPGFEFLKKIMRSVLGKKLFPSGRSENRTKKLENPIIQKLWQTLALVDLMLLWGLYVRLSSIRGKVVICDRYLNDTLLDFRRNFPAAKFEESILWGVLRFIVPEPDHSFLIWIPVEVSLKRSIAKGEPFPDDKETLEWRLGAYLNEANFPVGQFTLIDGRNSVEENYEKLLASITVNCRKGYL